MPEKPTCRNGNAYGGVIVLQGWHPTQCNCIKWKIWYHLGLSKNNVIQTWPRLQMRKLSRQPNASKNKLNSLSNGLKRSYTIQRSWWLMRETRLYDYVYSRNHCLRRFSAGLNMCDWTWQHVTRERLTRATLFSSSKVVHYFPNFRSYFGMEYEQPWNMGKILLECLRIWGVSRWKFCRKIGCSGKGSC